MLRDCAATFRDEIIIRLGGEVGLRSFEIPQVTPKHVKREEVDGSRYYFLRVPRGKDTTGGGGKPRDAYLPDATERTLNRYAGPDVADVGNEEPFVDFSRSTVQRAVKRAGAAAAEKTGDADYELVTSHDLRRFFGHQCLVEKRMNPEVVMEIGGWEDYDALKPYLDAPSVGTIVGEFERAGLA